MPRCSGIAFPGARIENIELRSPGMPRSRRVVAGQRSAWRPMIHGTAGLIILLVAGRLIVSGGTGIADSFAISQFVMGATIVAIGTSIPELATAVIAKVRGHDDVSLGMMLGSNIFNSLWIVAVAAVVFPIELDWRQVGLALAAGVIVMIAAFPPRSGLLGRRRGAVLISLYVAYVAAVLAW